MKTVNHPPRMIHLTKDPPVGALVGFDFVDEGISRPATVSRYVFEVELVRKTSCGILYAVHADEKSPTRWRTERVESYETRPDQTRRENRIDTYRTGQRLIKPIRTMVPATLQCLAVKRIGKPCLRLSACPPLISSYLITGNLQATVLHIPLACLSTSLCLCHISYLTSSRQTQL